MSRGSTLKHNKRRNVGLVYRMLVKCLSESMVTKDNRRGQSTMLILQKYFSEGAPLARELSLHRVIQENRGVSEMVARRVVEDVIRESASFDHRALDIKKSSLIKDINYTLGQDFFDRYRIPEYRAIASTHLLISRKGSSVVSESVDRARLEESVVRYMTTLPERRVAPPEPERNSLAFKMASEEYNKQYEGLSQDQKRVIDAYLVGAVKGGDYLRFRRVVETQRETILDSLGQYARTGEAASDKVLAERIGQVRDIAEALRPDGDPDVVLEDIMMLQEIVDEIGRK